MVAVIGLTTATYAWFTSVTTNEAKDIDLYVNAADAMMLSALAAPEFNRADDWIVTLSKNEITNSDRGNQTNAFPLNGITAVSSLFNSQASGFYTATHTNLGELNGFSSIAQQNNFVKFTLWVKTTRNGFIYLDKNSLVSALSLEPTLSAVAGTIRIGFVPINYDQNGTEANGVVLGEDYSSAVIWEPNSTNHLAHEYGGPTEAGKLPAYAVKNAVVADNPINTVAITNATNTAQGSFDFIANQTNVKGTGFYNQSGEPVALTSDDKIALFNMNMDTMQQFSIYIWVEGTDLDTVNNVSKSSFRTYLKFGQEYDRFIGSTFIPKI